MSYELLAGGEVLGEVQGAWQALESAVTVHVFQTWSFARLWYDTAGRRADALPLVVRYTEGGRAKGLFPACLVRYGPARLLTWLGGPHVLDYGDVLFDPTASIAAEEFVAESLRMLRERAPLAFTYLGNVREDAVAYPALAAGLRVYKRSVAPYLPIRGDFDGYLASLSRHRRRDLRRMLAGLGEAGELRFRLLGRDDAELEAVVDQLLEFKRQRYGGTAFRGHTESFRRLQALQDPHTYVGALTIGGRLAAAELVCIYRDRMYLLVPGFDPEFAGASPGKGLRYHLVKECFARGLDACDFGWGGAPHKYRWTEESMPLATFVSDDLQGSLLTAASKLNRLPRRVLQVGGAVSCG